MDATNPNPEQGLRMLFFSGGTALGPVAKALTRFTHNAIHVITTFDSGGSSAALRQAFHMPAVGDIRARIMALADSSVSGNLETVALFAHRLPLDATRPALHEELVALAKGQHSLTRAVPEPMRQVVVRHLSDFLTLMPDDLDLAGASIGNLVLTTGYLSHAHQLEPVATIFSKLVQALGIVRPVVNEYAHLCVQLENGDLIIGQHRFTGKTGTSIASPIKHMWLTRSLDDPAPITLHIRPRLTECIRQADLICYPVGSFYSSVLANLLPFGVSQAILAAPCLKVFIPNLGTDPELFGLSIQDQVEKLLREGKGGETRKEREEGEEKRIGGRLQRLSHEQEEQTGTATQRLSHEQDRQVGTGQYGMLDIVLADVDETRYPGGIPHGWLKKQGIQVYSAPLVVTPPFLDAERVCAALLDIGHSGRKNSL